MKEIIRIDETGWIRCGGCGHKLFKTTSTNQNDVIYSHKVLENIGVEIKCHSCKKINVAKVGDD